MVDLKAFLSMVLKNGGAQLVVVLVLAWLFQQYFPLDQVLVSILLGALLIAAFIDGLIRLFTATIFWILYKVLKFLADKASGNYEEVTKEVQAGDTVKAVAQDMGLDLISIGLSKVQSIKDRIAASKDAAEIADLEAQLVLVEEQLAALQNGTVKG